MRPEPFVARLREVLPPSWQVDIGPKEEVTSSSRRAAILQIAAPDGCQATLLVEVKGRVSAREAAALGPGLAQSTAQLQVGGAILFTRFVSRMAQERLRGAGVSYLDLTGNLWVRIERPAVFLERAGAERDPDPPASGVRSLKGTKAVRLVRALCDWAPPVGVRELARRAGTNAGYATRVLTFLEADDLVVRSEQGEVLDVRWQDLLRRWSADYSVTETNRTMAYLAPRGIAPLRRQLSSYSGRYAVTGSFAVPAPAQIISSPLFTCYMADPEAAAQALDLRPTDAGGNVLLLEPFDDVVFTRTRATEGGTSAVALTQCVVDLLTGSGREPAQGDALISWMTENENVWRS